MTKSSIESKGRAAPISVRLNSGELKALQARAGSMPLSTFMKQAALGPEAPRSGTRRHRPGADHVLIGQTLGQLGQSGIADSLRRLARQAGEGTLLVDETTKAKLMEAFEAVCSMRILLLQALGTKILQQAGAGPDLPSSGFGLPGGPE